MARILVVDDDAAVRSAISSWVTSDGHDVIDCATLADALGMLRVRPVDVVMLDRSLILDTSEKDVVNAFGKVAPQAALLMMSGMTSSDTRSQDIGSPQSGRMMFLQKPFRPAALSRAINLLTAKDPFRKVSR